MGATVSRKVAEVMHEWSQGVAYELIKGRLCFAAHPSDEHTIKVIKRFPHRFYFSSPLPGGRPWPSFPPRPRHAAVHRVLLHGSVRSDAKSAR